MTPAGKPYAASERAHLRARFTVESMDRRTGEETVKDLVVEGAGLGYLGRQAVAVASAIQDRVPHVYGFADGLIYRDWLPPVPHEAPDGHESVTLAQTVASYVYARRRALPAPLASADRLGGREHGLGSGGQGAVRPVRAAGLAVQTACARAAHATTSRT